MDLPGTIALQASQSWKMPHQYIVGSGGMVIISFDLNE